MKNGVTFLMTEQGITLAAIFIAQLVIHGIVFTTRSDTVSMEISLTGGF
ncbi:MAG: hypothetical protein WC107_07430 [Patescibacteria group bacterium]